MDDLNHKAATQIMRGLVAMPVSEAFVLCLKRLIDSELGGRRTIWAASSLHHEVELADYDRRLHNAARKVAEVAEQYYVGVPNT